MKRLLILCLCAYGIAAGGCGAQSVILGTESSYLFTVMDRLAPANQRIELRVRLQGGDLLQAQTGYVVRFYRDGKLFKAAQTDAGGVAEVSFTPPEAGDYRFLVDVAQAGLPEKAPNPQELLVASRQADAPIAIVDLDKTVVASGFHRVLIGDPAPMAGSAALLQRLASTHTVVYLTHRPDYFGIKSKAWLKEHDYPPGPVLLSSISGFLKGSGAYKSDMLRQLKEHFERIEIGIGDKISDALAYHENSMKSFVILQIPESDDPAVYERMAAALEDLPEVIAVVTNWGQIERALFEEASFPPSALKNRLRQMADQRKKAAEAAGRQ